MQRRTSGKGLLQGKQEDSGDQKSRETAWSKDPRRRSPKILSCGPSHARCGTGLPRACLYFHFACVHGGFRFVVMYCLYMTKNHQEKLAVVRRSVEERKSGMVGNGPPSPSAAASFAITLINNDNDDNGGR